MGGFARRTAVSVALTVAMTLAAAGAASAAPTAWTAVGSLANGRYDHAATLLKSGRVLVTGGYDGVPSDGAELYDPGTATWSNAAPMRLARTGHGAVRLQSGKVLVVGGSVPSADPAASNGAYTRTAEIYDPATDSWTQAASMGTARFQPTVTLLDDGRVLVAGGVGDVDTANGTFSAVALKSAEIFDPRNGSWTDVGSMSVGRSMATATLLSDGKVLEAGGYDDTAGELASAELFDPAAGAWSPTGSLAQARDSASAVALSNGDVLVAGGDGGAGALDSAEAYRPSTGLWHAAARLATARQTAGSVVLKDGTVLVAGGETSRFGEPLGSAELYDAGANAWTGAAAMGTARRQFTLTALDDGRALAVGGNPGGFDRGLAGVERFSTMTATLTAVDFGHQLVGSATDPKDAVLTNNGSAPLLVTGVSVRGADAGDFVIVSNGCLGAPVAPGASCTISLRFTPGAAGARGATLTATDDQTASGATTAALSGTGDRPASGDTSTSGSGSPSGSGTPGGSAAAGGSAATDATGDSAPSTGGGSEPAHAVLDAAATRTTCAVTTSRRGGRTGSAVTCSMSWPAGAGTVLGAKLMRARTTLASTRTTVRTGSTTLTLRPARRLRAGSYTVLIARPDGTVITRRSVHAS